MSARIVEHREIKIVEVPVDEWDEYRRHHEGNAWELQWARTPVGPIMACFIRYLPAPGQASTHQDRPLTRSDQGKTISLPADAGKTITLPIDDDPENPLCTDCGHKIGRDGCRCPVITSADAET